MLSRGVAYALPLLSSSSLPRFYARIARKRGKQKGAMTGANKPLHTTHWTMLTRGDHHSLGFDPVIKPAR